MNTKSNLDLARKYEWNAMLAEHGNNLSEKNRYEAMAKMALIDAAKSKEYEERNRLKNNSFNNCNSSVTGDSDYYNDCSNLTATIIISCIFLLSLIFAIVDMVV